MVRCLGGVSGERVPSRELHQRWAPSRHAARCPAVATAMRTVATEASSVRATLDLKHQISRPTTALPRPAATRGYGASDALRSR
jgi:hypothetical protein